MESVRDHVRVITSDGEGSYPFQYIARLGIYGGDLLETKSNLHLEAYPECTVQLVNVVLSLNSRHLFGQIKSTLDNHLSMLVSSIILLNDFYHKVWPASICERMKNDKGTIHQLFQVAMILEARESYQFFFNYALNTGDFEFLFSFDGGRMVELFIFNILLDVNRGRKREEIIESFAGPMLTSLTTNELRRKVVLRGCAIFELLLDDDEEFPFPISFSQFISNHRKEYDEIIGKLNQHDIPFFHRYNDYIYLTRLSSKFSEETNFRVNGPYSVVIREKDDSNRSVEIHCNLELDSKIGTENGPYDNKTRHTFSTKYDEELFSKNNLALFDYILAYWRLPIIMVEPLRGFYSMDGRVIGPVSTFILRDQKYQTVERTEENSGEPATVGYNGKTYSVVDKFMHWYLLCLEEERVNLMMSEALSPYILDCVLVNRDHVTQPNPLQTTGD